jgi:hypothetical protein
LLPRLSDTLPQFARDVRLGLAGFFVCGFLDLQVGVHLILVGEFLDRVISSLAASGMRSGGLVVSRSHGGAL